MRQRILTLIARLLGRYRYHVVPLGWLLISVERSGIWFPWKGDEILMRWRVSLYRLRYVSVGFSGTGEFGDAQFNSIAEIERAWKEYFSHDRQN